MDVLLLSYVCMFADLLTRVQDFFVWDVMWVSGVVLGMVLFSYTLGRYAMVPLFAALVTAGVLSTHAAYVDHIPFLATLAEHEERVIMFFVGKVRNNRLMKLLNNYIGSRLII